MLLEKVVTDMKANKATTLQDITAGAYKEKDLHPFCGGPLSLADAAGTADAGNLDHRMGDDECGCRDALGDRPLDRG